MARRRTRRSAALALAVLAAACGRGGDPQPIDAAEVETYYLQASYPAEYRVDGRVVTGRTLARGDSLYQGAIGRANCLVCHGPFLNGGSRGMNLRNRVWFHGDGSLDFLVRVTTEGVEEAQASPVPYMPPMGGIPLAPDEVEAIAAYVHWYASSHPAAEDPPASDRAGG